MDFFSYRQQELFAEELAVEELVARYGTPLYIYSRATLERHVNAWTRAAGQHPHLICYAVKANSNLAVLDVLHRAGCGFDIVSGGELARVKAAGGRADRTLFSGVGKTSAEIEQALAAGVRCLNVESPAELDRITEIARRTGRQAPVSIRVNPDVDAQTHPYIATGLRENKFGIEWSEAAPLYRVAAARPELRIMGIDCHIGSQLVSMDPLLEAFDRLLTLVDSLGAEGIELHHIDVGGGLGVRYQDEQPPEPEDYVQALLKKLGDRKIELIFEPGRSIVANAGILVTRVEYLKKTSEKNFVIVDAGMNDLLRPALYSAWQEIVPVSVRDDIPTETVDIVGPVCETADFLGRERELAVQAGDLLAVRSSGAYSFAMSSNYNARDRAAEVLVDGRVAYLARARETVAQQMAGETRLPD